MRKILNMINHVNMLYELDILRSKINKIPLKDKRVQRRGYSSWGVQLKPSYHILSKLIEHVISLLSIRSNDSTFNVMINSTALKPLKILGLSLLVHLFVRL